MLVRAWTARKVRYGAVRGLIALVFLPMLVQCGSDLTRGYELRVSALRFEFFRRR